jgi:hypothetical protein
MRSVIRIRPTIRFSVSHLGHGSLDTFVGVGDKQFHRGGQACAGRRCRRAWSPSLDVQAQHLVPPLGIDCHRHDHRDKVPSFGAPFREVASIQRLQPITPQSPLKKGLRASTATIASRPCERGSRTESGCGFSDAQLDWRCGTSSRATAAATVFLK